jgi:hypothetical protein
MLFASARHHVDICVCLFGSLDRTNVCEANFMSRGTSLLSRNLDFSLFFQNSLGIRERKLKEQTPSRRSPTNLSCPSRWSRLRFRRRMRRICCRNWSVYILPLTTSLANPYGILCPDALAQNPKRKHNLTSLANPYGFLCTDALAPNPKRKHNLTSLAGACGLVISKI